MLTVLRACSAGRGAYRLRNCAPAALHACSAALAALGAARRGAPSALGVCSAVAALRACGAYGATRKGTFSPTN